MELTDFIDSNRGPLIGLIVSWGAPWGDAMEIAQDSFSEAWLCRESCRGDLTDPDVSGRWLRGVALNRYRTWARTRSRRQARFVSIETAVTDSIIDAQRADPPEHLEALRNAIQRLPALQREVVLMHYLEETSVKQVAALLSVTSKTVEGRLFQARQTLRRMLDENTSTSKPSTSKIVRMFLCL